MPFAVIETYMNAIRIEDGDLLSIHPIHLVWSPTKGWVPQNLGLRLSSDEPNPEGFLNPSRLVEDGWFVKLGDWKTLKIWTDGAECALKSAKVFSEEAE
jgi:hypothetical protein